MSRHLLVPVDDSEASWQAFDHALTEGDADHVTALHVVDPTAGDYYHDDAERKPVQRSKSIRDAARARFEAAERPANQTFEFVEVTGRPAPSILTFIEGNDVDAVVMGSRGRTGISRVLLGSVAESVVRRSPVPVTIVR